MSPRRRILERFGLLAAIAVAAACTTSDRGPVADSSAVGPGSATVACSDHQLRTVVRQFGERVRDVSLLAPDSLVRGEIRGAYEPHVTPRLLASWLAHPDSAPGRHVSSPWPARITIDSAVSSDDGGCRVTGWVVYVTSADTLNDALRSPVTLHLTREQTWRIDGYTEAPVPLAGPTAAAPNDPVDVLRRYYAAIDAHDYRTAFALWGSAGASSGQSFEQFVAGFRNTARVTASIGSPGRIEGAAGSRYITIPVTLETTSSDGTTQRFIGTYTLRRAVVDGATPAQRRWHIYSAALRARGDS